MLTGASVLLICDVECFSSLEFFLFSLGQEGKKKKTKNQQQEKEHLTNHISPSESFH